MKTTNMTTLAGFRIQTSSDFGLIFLSGNKCERCCYLVSWRHLWQIIAANCSLQRHTRKRHRLMSISRHFKKY